MSWLKSAVSKAVEVGNNSNLTRAVKNYADTVVQQAGQAVADGAKILQDRIATLNFRSAKQTIKRLEEAAVSCRGQERSLLMRRWLEVLKEAEKSEAGSSEDNKYNAFEQYLLPDDAREGLRKVSTILYYDADVGGEPLPFRDIFLQSQALEGITLSMILHSPNEDEIALLLELFGVCLTGGKEVHIAILSSIQDLATVFTKYKEEVLVKREELLQFVQGAITGLKINAEMVRIDAEAADLKNKLDGITVQGPTNETKDNESVSATNEAIEALKEALAKIRTCSRLEELLLRKKSLTFGDTPEIHAQKIDKLKVLTESLASSVTKSEKRIVDQRVQKEEALKVRLSKSDEANEKEKEIGAEITVLEKERDELEAQLKKVNISLAAANARLNNAREEREQFLEANNQIIEHLNAKEDELTGSITACKVESNVLGTWVNFLEDTWVLQRSYVETTEKQATDELENHEEYFTKLAVNLLTDYKKELEPSIGRIGTYVENLKALSLRSEVAASADNQDSQVTSPRRHLEEEYMDYEAKIVTTFSVVDNMREQFYAQKGASYRKDDERVKELFDEIEKLRQEFDAIERPILEVEVPSSKQEPTSEERSSEISPHPIAEPPKGEPSSPKPPAELPKKPATSGGEAGKPLDADAELAKLESVFGKLDPTDYSAEEVGEWEFDELERELRAGDHTKS
ncbi:unnamed protein product [Linum tenue]|uniref:Uncharacterized protein n=1 Tax=Linum tenue TaxID=586396 RepID=A0AAV0JSE4_9ROSI|nr:unnamed protein product [Linum tenue]